MAIDLQKIRYFIADNLFEAELDDAYEMGVREGITHALREIVFAVDLKESSKLTKTQLVGYQKAIAALADKQQELKRNFQLPYL